VAEASAARRVVQLDTVPWVTERRTVSRVAADEDDEVADDA
jgi:hypothetical protein